MSVSSSDTSHRGSLDSSNRVEGRTPKRIRSMEPDLTVVVGGVEYRHYKAILCAASEYFDTMLSAGMKEQETSRIEFPDKDPEEWLLVYNFLDPIGSSRPLFTTDNALNLLAWFDYLGHDGLVNQVDNFLHNSIEVMLFGMHANQAADYLVQLWHQYKPYRGLRNAKAKIRLLLRQNLMGWLQSPYVTDTEQIRSIKPLLLDPECRTDLWTDLLSKVRIPPEIFKQMKVGSVYEAEVVMSPLFDYLVVASKSMKWGRSPSLVRKSA